MSTTELPQKDVAELREHIDHRISLWSMRPAPRSSEGKAWEAGARQGAEWAIEFLASQSLEREAEVRRLAIEECAARIGKFSAGQIKAACGEMSAQEMRTVKAVQGWWVATLQSVAQQPPAKEGETR